MWQDGQTLLCSLWTETIHDKTMRVHRKMHLTRPFLCSVRDCFNTKEDLNEHRKLHQVDGFQCDHFVTRNSVADGREQGKCPKYIRI